MLAYNLVNTICTPLLSYLSNNLFIIESSLLSYSNIPFSFSKHEQIHHQLAKMQFKNNVNLLQNEADLYQKNTKYDSHIVCNECVKYKALILNGNVSKIHL